MSDLLAKSMRLAPYALAVFAVGSMLLSTAHAIGRSPAGPGCDPTGSAACGVFVPASHPYRGEGQ